MPTGDQQGAGGHRRAAFRCRSFRSCPGSRSCRRTASGAAIASLIVTVQGGGINAVEGHLLGSSRSVSRRRRQRCAHADRTRPATPAIRGAHVWVFGLDDTAHTTRRWRTCARTSGRPLRGRVLARPFGFLSQGRGSAVAADRRSGADHRGHHRSGYFQHADDERSGTYR